MPIVSGRHNDIPVDDRKCNLCDLNDHFNKIGDEFHYFIQLSLLQRGPNKVS